MAINGHQSAGDHLSTAAYLASSHQCNEVDGASSVCCMRPQLCVQGKRDRKKVSYHNAGGGDMDGSEYEASSDDEETEEEGDELEPVRASCR